CPNSVVISLNTLTARVWLQGRAVWRSVPNTLARSCAIYECCLSVSISDACQCPSVPPHQCSLSVPITAASLAHISEGEKSHIYKIF
ncbi:unnamed protein product, partial [Staurois parvus]